MNGVDTIRTELDERKSEERQYQRELEGYDQMTGWLADRLGVSSNQVVKAERPEEEGTPELEEGETLLYVGDEEATEAYVLQEQVPDSRKEEVSEAFATYREVRPSASAGVYDGATAEQVAVYKNSDIAVTAEGRIQRRDESTAVDINPGSELEPGDGSERVERMLERHDEEGLKVRSS